MSHTLYTLAYPVLEPHDRDLIEDFRRKHDRPFRDVVDAHFTLIFAAEVDDRSSYVAHVRSIAERSSRIRFVCRYAMLGSDHANDNAYVFLVPDEGYSDISLLHDRLYSGSFRPMLRLDVPFVPHIGIGTLKDRRDAKDWCDRLNETDLKIEGSLESVSVCSMVDGRIVDLETIPLMQSKWSMT